MIIREHAELEVLPDAVVPQLDFRADAQVACEDAHDRPVR
jgi:hypothetical protein